MELTRLESAADAIIAAATERDGALREIAQLLEARVEHYDWVGFYLAEGRELVLGPFVGAPTEHIRIPFGCGVCGQVAESGETLVVPNVAAEANYLSCAVRCSRKLSFQSMPTASSSRSSTSTRTRTTLSRRARWYSCSGSARGWRSSGTKLK